MAADPLLEELVPLVSRPSRPLRCGVAGHGAGHHCLPVPPRVRLAELTTRVSTWYGPLRNLVMGGFTDPTVGVTTGLPLLTPFAGRVLEMRAWACGHRWIGAGTVAEASGPRVVLVVAQRTVPGTEGLPADASRLRQLAAVTGWTGTARPRTTDWAAVEERLGTALPGDYKELVDLFGPGDFDGHVTLHVPASGLPGTDLVEQAEFHAGFASQAPDLWKPYPVHPAPGGLLMWGASETADEFYWLTEGDDPDSWPVLARQDVPDSWIRFPGPVTEFLFRMLTDRAHPFSMARHYDAHWFESYATP